MKFLKAASNVIAERGINQLTLDAVAEEANVSKGGLQYHFRTKDALIRAMNEHVIEQFRALIDEEVQTGQSYHEAYLKATLTGLDDNNFLNVNTSLLAAITNTPSTLDLWKEEYHTYREQLAKENYNETYSLLVQTVCDGLWFSKIFGLTPLDNQDKSKLVEMVLQFKEVNEK